MKQRVAIARALANEPRILLMDEPFGALDAQTRASMQAHLLKICEDVDITILFITHDLDEAIYLSDRIVVLGAHPGRMLEIIEVPVAAAAQHRAVPVRALPRHQGASGRADPSPRDDHRRVGRSLRQVALESPARHRPEP